MRAGRMIGGGRWGLVECTEHVALACLVATFQQACTPIPCLAMRSCARAARPRHFHTAPLSSICCPTPPHPTGASPISQEVMTFLRICFGATVLEGYGMTESSSAMSLTRPDDLTTGA